MIINRFIVIKLEQNNTGETKPVIIGSARDKSVAIEIRNMDMDDWSVRHSDAVIDYKNGVVKCQYNPNDCCHWYVEATNIAIDNETKKQIISSC